MGVTFRSMRPMLRTKDLHGTASLHWLLLLQRGRRAALWADGKERAKIAYPMEEFHYGMREFAIDDNNGYMLQFGSPTRQ